MLCMRPKGDNVGETSESFPIQSLLYGQTDDYAEQCMGVDES